MVHEVRPVALDLLVGGDRAEDDLGEALRGEHPEANAADRSTVFHQRQRLVLRVEHQSEEKKL